MNISDLNKIEIISSSSFIDKLQHSLTLSAVETAFIRRQDNGTYNLYLSTLYRITFGDPQFFTKELEVDLNFKDAFDKLIEWQTEKETNANHKLTNSLGKSTNIKEVQKLLGELEKRRKSVIKKGFGI